MPKRSENRSPKPLKVRNSLAVYVDKKRIVFGNYDDPTSWKKFADFCEIRKNGENVTPTTPEPSVSSGNSSDVMPLNAPGKPVLIGELVTLFLEFAEKAKNPGDFRTYKTAGKALWRHKSLATAEFDAYLLLQIQEGFVKAGYARDYCNKLVNFIIGIFRWGEPRRLVPKGKRIELRAVEPLRYGQAQRESKEREDVAREIVERTLPFLLPVYQAIIRILLLTGARPSEILRLKVGDVDRTNPKVWVYRPAKHKTVRKKKRRTLVFGAEEQTILLPYLEGKDPNTAVFAPADAVAERKAVLRAARKTPVQPSQQARDKQRSRNPNTRIGKHFTSTTVGCALKTAIEKANLKLPTEQQIPAWTLYQLRYSFISEMVEQYDENIAALMAGHSDTQMVRRIYDKSQERRLVKLKQMEGERGRDETEGREAG